MSSLNIIFLQKTKFQKIGEILLFTFSVIAFAFLLKEYANKNFLLNEVIFGYICIFGLLAVFSLFTIILPLKIYIGDDSIYIKYLPKLYKRISNEDIFNISPITECEFNFFEKWWYGIYSCENLYLISTRYRNYYINCKSNSIDTMNCLIHAIQSGDGSLID